MGDCEIENCKCCKQREHAWSQYGRVLKENKTLRAALEKIRSNMFLVCQPNQGHFFGEVDDLITEALASEEE